MTDSKSNLFETALQFPDPDAGRRLGRLVGLDEHKERLSKQLAVRRQNIWHCWLRKLTECWPHQLG